MGRDLLPGEPGLAREPVTPYRYSYRYRAAWPRPMLIRDGERTPVSRERASGSVGTRDEPRAGHGAVDRARGPAQPSGPRERARGHAHPPGASPPDELRRLSPSSARP